MIFPVVLGEGKRIFGDRHAAGDAEDRRSHGLRRAARSSPPTSRPARSRPAPLRPKRAERGASWSAGTEMGARAAGEPGALRPPVQQSYTLEGADRALGGRDAVRLSHGRPDQPDECDELKRHWPFGMFPLLLDDGEPVFETTDASSSICRPIIRARTSGSRKARKAAGRASSTASSTSHHGQHAAGRSTDALRPEGMRRRVWRGAGRGSAAHRLRLARADLPGDAWAAGDTLHPGRLRRRAVPILCRLGRARSATSARG